MSGGPAKTRIEAVEMMLNGKIDEGSLSSRLEALANVAFTDGVISVESVTLPKDSVIKVEFTEELSSREDKAWTKTALRTCGCIPPVPPRRSLTGP